MYEDLQMCPACQPPPIRDRKLNHDTLAMARVFQQTARLEGPWPPFETLSVKAADVTPLIPPEILEPIACHLRITDCGLRPGVDARRWRVCPRVGGVNQEIRHVVHKPCASSLCRWGWWWQNVETGTIEATGVRRGLCWLRHLCRSCDRHCSPLCARSQHR